MPINIRGEFPAGDANDFTPAQVDQNWLSLYGTPNSLTIASGVITVNGSGTYRISPESGAVDDVTAIAGAQRVGDEVSFLNLTPTHLITYKHQGNLHLGGTDFIADTVYALVTFKCVLLSPMTWVAKTLMANT